MWTDLGECTECPEREHARKPVPGVGNHELAQVAFLGRNPGEDEDKLGRPFVGRAGGKFNEGLVHCRLLRNSVYVTNLVKCKTPKDIVPSAKCRRTCARKWLDPELARMTNLQLIVTLGNEALQYLEPLGRVGELHGTHWEMDWMFLTQAATPIHLFCSYHPSAALRSSTFNHYFVKDMIKLGYLLKDLGISS